MYKLQGGLVLGYLGVGRGARRGMEGKLGLLWALFKKKMKEFGMGE